MVRLSDSENGKVIGEISDVQFQFLQDMLEEESIEDQDYYIDSATLELFEQAGAHPDFIAMLRNAIGDREGVDLRWE